MVLVKRREDGLYYNGARANAGFRRGAWLDDIQQCLPYTNEALEQQCDFMYPM